MMYSFSYFCKEVNYHIRNIDESKQKIHICTHNLFDEYPEAAKAWDPELNLPTKPWDVLPGSNKIYQWRCGKHSWESTVMNVVKRVKEGRPPCPECGRNARWHKDV